MSAASATLPFDAFWNWLLRHPNCILRAGTADAVLYDDASFHWFFAAEEERLFVQVIRGKRLVGEILLDPDQVAYVESFAEEREGEFAFEAIGESATERRVICFFVLSHGFDEEDDDESGLPVH